MFKFLHAADLHLDSPLHGLERYEGAPVEEIRGATRRALENLVQLAIDEDVDFVLLAGDLYDGDWKDHNTGLFFVSQVVKLRDAGIAVYAIAGNHDAANKMTRSLRLPDNPDETPVMLPHKRPDTVLLPALEVAIHGQGFATAAVEESVIPDYPAARPGWFNIGLLHTSLEDDSGEHARYAPCTVAELRAKGYQYWALGHIHKRRLLISSDPTIVFPGNPQGRHIREDGEKGCQLVTVDDRGQAQPEFRPLDVFRWQRCDVTASDARRPDDVLATIATALTCLIAESDGLPLAVRVRVCGPCPVHQQLLADPLAWTNEVRAAAMAAGEGKVWVEKVQLQTTPMRTLDDAALADGPIGELLALVRELRDDDERLAGLYSDLADLDRKLPDDCKRGEDAIRLRDPGQLRTLLDEVQPLLIGQLLRQGDDR